MALDQSGGTASIKEIGLVGSNGFVYNSSLNAICASSWSPTGTLCSYAQDTNLGVLYGSYGATWGSYSDPTVVGYLLIDLGEEKTIGSFEVFQMYSDGKATHVQIFSHPSSSSTLPTQLDAGWSEVTAGMTAVGAGNVSGGLIIDPLKIQLPSPLTTRYLKIHAMNDGSLGSTNYVELRSIRAFAP